jgi:malic enzyme
MKQKQKPLLNNTLLGAGEAAIGIANLISMAVEKTEGIPKAQAAKRIWMKDSKGLIVQGRPEGGISEHKAPFAQDHTPMKDLGEIVKEVKPTVLIGAAAIGMWQWRYYRTELRGRWHRPGHGTNKKVNKLEIQKC